MPLLLLAVVHYLLSVRHYGVLTPDGLFVCTQLLMVVGTAALVEPGSSVDNAYLQMMVAAVMIYIAASCVTYLALRTRSEQLTPPRSERRTFQVSLVPPKGPVLLVTALSLAIMLTYFAAVGYSAFLLGLQGQLSGSPQDVATLRLQSYAGETYLFPGYANQFKNVIYPALVVVILTWVFMRSGLAARLGGLVLVGLAVFGLLGTGQRGAFILFLVTLLIYVFLVNRRRVSRWVLLLPAMGLPFALLATYALGRSAGAADSPVAATSEELYRRFLNDNQLSGLAAYRYTESLPVQYGREWLAGLQGILPGDRGSSLANEVFATLYGSTVGTAPPSLWGSAHHNFGTLGVLVFAALLGVALQVLTFRSLRRASYNTLELIGYAGVTATVGTWTVAGPDALMNLGLVAYLLIWYGGARWSRSGRPAFLLVSAEDRRRAARRASAYGTATGRAPTFEPGRHRVRSTGPDHPVAAGARL
ncbi:O-antigen polymerase [Micromonospora echinaurantiaca]|nr:O-antigen polymerase [Micromonospora echinaurantiaca]